ncbi:MAG: Argininosuccinate lyase [Parcubacteria group bacterium GW2011_GWA2_43_17]|nr:MAG: Argininosuccinate lyase [Parcubacteria group bacterium GW2011_GWA2_43_17]KKT91260.1 MAG: Argininosuccinate lyase [Parcubacteria group bacterium GW2011_GWF2_45_11]KKT97038.1 MAG: Argininosuccinate lyase [Parcubacteria group bacterium GW2011_GWC2_45_15]OGY92455.1 MAG: argininosuccinate lyase [Candidatus Komeilibacteria bacterium RIFOXYA2_FULL_45_9]OGY94776.1 MAG: argininosuccinate lyase [Candidatus Komeilibacteria bacterium RIFOXYC2_FULL_45_12]HAH04398.1 argininosuccinate lyase [Candidat
MTKIWQSKSTKLHPLVEKYTVGNDYELDKRLLPYDVQASKAHAQALAKLKIISKTELAKLTRGLNEILKLHQAGKFVIKLADEDCHTAIENYLIKKLGPLGKKIHTGRSRNDQVLVATRLYTRKKLKQISQELVKLEKVFLNMANKYQNLPLPGYTHTRRAMPSSVGHWSAAYLEELIDDHKLLESAYNLNDQNPLGAAAGYGVNFRLDRKMTSRLLKFKRTQINSLYAVNSRGKTESYILAVSTQIMMTLGRLANEMIWFTTPEFNFFHLPWEFTTGSSIMPQKRNPDVFEILRSNVSVIVALQTQIKDISKNLISGYNRDTQLTKEPLIKGLGITRRSLEIAALIMPKIKPNAKVLIKSLTTEMFANHEANKLVKKGMPFREAYQQVKENLDKLTVPDPVKAIKEVVSLGGPGNLGLENYKIDKPL